MRQEPCSFSPSWLSHISAAVVFNGLSLFGSEKDINMSFTQIYDNAFKKKKKKVLIATAVMLPVETT